MTFDEFGAMLGAIRVNGEIYIFEPVRFYDVIFALFLFIAPNSLLIYFFILIF